MPFDDRSSNLDLNGPNIEIKTDAYGHAPGSTSSKTVVNPFGDDQGRTGGTIEITGVGTATWPVGFETYASNTGTIGYQWHELGTGPLGVSTRYEGETTDTLKLKYLDNPGDNLKQYYVTTRVIPSAYSLDGATVTAGTARSTGYAINETADTSRVTVTVLPELTLDTQPTDQTATVNNWADFSTEASVTDDSTISYQWYIDGQKITSSPIYTTSYVNVRKERYAKGSSNGRDNSIIIPEDATNVKVRVGGAAGGYGGSDTNGGGGSGGYGRVGYFTLPDGGRTLTIRVGERGSNGGAGRNAVGGNGGLITGEGDGGWGGAAPDSGAGGGGASGCYVYDSLTSSTIIACGGGGGGGGGSWNVPGNAGESGSDWISVTGDLGDNPQRNGSTGSRRPSSNQSSSDTSVVFTITNMRKVFTGNSFEMRGGIGGGNNEHNVGKGSKNVNANIGFNQRHQVWFNQYGVPGGIGHVQFRNNWKTLYWFAPYTSHYGPPDLAVTCSKGQFSGQGCYGTGNQCLLAGTSMTGAYNYRAAPSHGPTLYWTQDPPG